MMNNYSNQRSSCRTMPMGQMNQENRRDCPCNPEKPQPQPQPKPQRPCPTLSREQLMNYINEVSFAVNDMNLYLDTHPNDICALEFCLKHVKMRNEALKEYAKFYGPLTIDTTDDVKSNCWEWVMKPWPWERKEC